MTKKNSKFLSLLLAAVMALSMAMTGFAATITITNSSEDETYKAYKIFDVTTVTDENDEVIGYSYTIDSESPWYDAVSAATNVFTLIEAGDSGTYYVTVKDGVDDEDVIAVFTSADIDLDEITPDGNATANSAGTATFTDLEPGYYFITTTLGSLVMINTADDTLTITEKNDVPTSDKKILEDDEEVGSESVDNTKTVTYVLYANGVKGAVNLVIHDQMKADGVDYTFNYNDIKVELFDGTETQELTADTHYTVTYEDLNDDCDFEVSFTETAEALFAACGEGSYVKVTISCTLNAGASSFSDDEVTIENGEQVTYGNDGSSTWDYADVYEYGFEIYKYTGSDEEQTALANAEFELTNESGEKAYFKCDSNSNTYVFEGWLANGADVPSDYTTVIKTNDKGMAYVEGLDEGTYTLTETKAPDGYNLLGQPISVTISADAESPDQFTVTQDNETVSDHTVSVENNAGSILPGTGGMGTTIFYIAGVLLIICAAAALIAKRRLDRQN